MYINYGDANFFENGCLVDSEHSDTCFDIIMCNPFCDEEDRYMFGQCQVDITDTWIDRNAILQYIGMTEKTFDSVQYAIGCMNYYSWDNFGAQSYAYEWTNMTKAEICEILKYQSIASDNLNIEW